MSFSPSDAPKPVRTSAPPPQPAEDAFARAARVVRAGPLRKSSLVERLAEEFGRDAQEISTLKARVEFYEGRERAICAAVGGVSDNGKYRADIISRLETLHRQAAGANHQTPDPGPGGPDGG